MAAILAKKLGMTQRFLEDGKVERVTVLEAGPCPVTALRKDERDGYAAVQLAFDAVQGEGTSPSRSSVTSKRPTPVPYRVLKEFRDEGSVSLQRRRDRHRRGTFSSRRQGEDLRQPPRARASRARSSVTTSQRGPKSHGSHNYRAPGSIGASAWPARVMKGIRGPGQMGDARITQRGVTVVDVIASQNLLLVRGAVPGGKGSLVEVRTDA